MTEIDFKNLSVGDFIEFGPYRVTKEEIIEFATEFDPAPFHTDEEAAKDTPFGALSASGWHICAMTMRMMCDAFILDSTSQGSPGVPVCKWVKPVYADDMLRGKSTVIDIRVSKSRPGIGFANFQHQVFNQNGELIMEMENAGIYKTENAA